MILPTKRLGTEQSLVHLGGQVLDLLNSSMTVTEVWAAFLKSRGDLEESPISFDWFVLALDWLYAIGTIDFDGTLIAKVDP